MLILANKNAFGGFDEKAWRAQLMYSPSADFFRAT